MFHNTSNIYTKDQIDKLGNSVIFLCQRIKPLSKTKLLKLVYIIEETSVKKFGVPFFNIRFDAWHLGPVSRDLYVEITGETFLLNDYIGKTEENGMINVIPKKDFSDDEFNDNEIALLEQITATFKYTSAEELVNLTHRKHSPWYITAEENGLLEAFDNGLATTSDVEIDLPAILLGDTNEMKKYQAHQEFIEGSRSLKR